MTTTTTTTMTNYQVGERVRYGCGLQLTGTFVRYMVEIPASVIGGRIVAIASDDYGTGSAWEKDTAVGQASDVGAHTGADGRYVGQNY